MSEKVYKRDIADACEEYSKIFGANKNLYRIIPSAVDGLKPVARRFLYTLYMGKGRNQTIKMAKAVGDTMSDYHPHGDASIFDVGARLASPLFNNINVVEGQGNFGGYKIDKAGAQRYIECKLSAYAKKCFFEDFEVSNVDMKDAYGGGDEPEYLPARYPHALFNPQLSGIGFAFASNIPPFNITEVLESTITLIKNPNAKILIAPDSPTGADIVDDGQFETICETGVGTFTLRGSTEVDDINNTITITSIPLQTTIDAIIRKIVELRKKGIFNEIKDIKDYTKNKTGVKTILYLEPTANPYKTLEKLYSKNTGLKATYPVGMKMIDDYQDYDYGVKSFLLAWIEFRRDTVKSQYNTLLVKALEEQHTNDTLLFITDAGNSEETITLAKDSEDSKDLSKKLIKRYGIDSHQASVIANMKVTAFNRESHRKYEARKIELIDEIARLESVLDDDSKIDEVIIAQLKEGIKLFGSDRKSKIIRDEKKEISDTDHIVAISRDGYVKKVSLDEQKIHQVGNSNGQYITMRVNNRDKILIFDSTGTISRVPVCEIPDMTLEDTGVLLERYFLIHGSVVSVLIEPTEKELKKIGKDVFFTFLTKQGFVKKTLLSEFANINGSSLAIKLPANDELVAVEFVTDNTVKDMVIYTNLGNGIRRDINEFAVMKANARGARQISMSEGEYCVGFDKIDPQKKYIFYITSAGRAKLTETKYFPNMKRKDDVLSLINLESNETLVGIKSVSREDKAIVYKKKTEPETIEVADIPILTRVAKAEKIIKTPKGDLVLSYTVVRNK